ncbi:MAG: SIR2 family protein [Acidobacteriota bacterium]|nr:SIR2 family protein [Acidobacteriota bacterium]
MTETLQRLKDRDWAVLLDRIDEKKCTPFLGAGVRSDGPTLRAKIARKWAEEYEYPLGGTDNLAHIARFISVNYDAEFTKRRLADQYRTIPPPDFDDPDDPYAILADLPLPVYITTNYDSFMYQALLHRNRDARQEVCRWNKLIAEPPSIFDDGFSPSVANPVVFHFHGHTGNLDSLVLTEDDYFEFLINVSKDPRLIPHRIEKAVTGSSLLLLGYRLNDWDFRVLFHMIASYMEIATSRTHVAVQIAPVADQAPEEQRKKAQNYLDLYFEKYKRLDIRIYWGTCLEFMSELKERRALSHVS